MSKKKGVSAEEKRDRILDIFHETADVFVLKDIEKLGAKKGVIQQTIKDVLQVGGFRGRWRAGGPCRRFAADKTG